METLSRSMSMRFLVLLSMSDFLKFSKNLAEIQHELHFCFHDSNNFCSRLTSAISLDAQVQFTLNTLSSIAKQTAGLALAMRS